MVPLIVVSAITRFFGKNRSLAEGLQIWKFALFAAFAMTVPYVMAAYFLGPEFPALLGSLCGLAIVVTAARKGFLVPRSEDAWEFDRKENWPSDWTGSIQPRDVAHHTGSMGMVKAWSPYLLVAVLLLATRIRTLPLGSWLQAWTINWPNILGTDVSASVQPLFLPGTIFIVTFAGYLGPASNPDGVVQEILDHLAQRDHRGVGRACLHRPDGPSVHQQRWRSVWL